MSRYSADYGALLLEVEQELLAPPKDPILVSYSAISWFPGRQFALFVTQDVANGRMHLVRHAWQSQEYFRDFRAYFDLDELCIRKGRIVLSEDEQRALFSLLDQLPALPETLQKDNVIVLDGSQYRLEIHTGRFEKTYHWRVPNEDLALFEGLIGWLMSFCPIEKG